MATNANAAIANAKQALKNADNFGQRETGNKKAGDDEIKSAPAAASLKPSYSQARSTRQSGEFMGIRSNEAPELNAALQAREDAKKALQ